MKSLLAAAALLLLAAGPAPLEAQEQPEGEQERQSGVDIRPALVDLGALPGQTTQTAITVRNPTGQRLRITATANPLERPRGVSAAEWAVFDAAQWVTVIPRTVELDPEQSSKINILVGTPAGAEPGGHYAAVQFRANPVVPDPAGAENIGAVIVPALLTVPGELRESVVAVSNIEIDRYRTEGPVPIRFVLRNTGNVHATPIGDVMVSDASGVVGIVRIDTSILLPQETREYKVQWNRTKLVGNLPPWHRYDVEAKLSYGRPSKTLRVPFSTIWAYSRLMFVLACTVPVALVLFAALLLVRRRQRRRWRWRRSKSNDRRSLGASDESSTGVAESMPE